jgi:hypothetical protein
VVTWRQAQVVPLPAQGVPVAKIAEVTFTSALAVDHRHWSTICVFVTASAAPWRRSNKISYSTIPAGQGHISIREPALALSARSQDCRSSIVAGQRAVTSGLVTRLVTGEPWPEVRSERPVTGGSGKLA